MIPSIFNILSKFSQKEEKKNIKLERSFSSKKVDKSFGQILFEKRIEDLVLEYENEEPEILISQINEAGKRYKSSKNEQDLENYKQLLASFIILVERKAYRIKIINRKKDISEDEIDYIIVEIEKRLVALMDSFLSSQKDILNIIDQVEGLIFKILV